MLGYLKSRKTIRSVLCIYMYKHEQMSRPKCNSVRSIQLRRTALDFETISTYRVRANPYMFVNVVMIVISCMCSKAVTESPYMEFST